MSYLQNIKTAVISDAVTLRTACRKKRGGYVRDIHVSDCILPNIQFHAVGYNDDGEGAPAPPQFSDCSFRRIRLLGVCRSLVQHCINS